MAEAPAFERSRAVFLRLVGLVYLIAFLSLATQLLGLVGREGVLPAAEFLARAREFYGDRAYTLFPSVFWWSASDLALQIGVWTGVILSIVAMTGLAPIPVLATLWALYLSLTVVGQTFLAFQWDILLLETGLLACLYAPLGWWPRGPGTRRSSTPLRWVLWGLAFKLTFLSGITKLVSGDPTWRDLSALTYHYETQPIPAWTSWFAHHAPDWVHTLSAGMMFVVELAVPWIIIVPVRHRRLRAVGVAFLCGLQLAIFATGNYGFFNLLAVVLYLSLLDDRHLAWLSRVHSPGQTPVTSPLPEPHPWRAVVTGSAVAIGLLSAMTVWLEITYRTPPPAWASQVRSVVQPLRSINGYGLFRTMTTERPEIIVEGTLDGTSWEPYAFRWKPGEVARRPTFVEPHMPRLDWLLWFAALDPDEHRYWLMRLVERLLEESPPVLDLIDRPPFSDRPPEAIRLSVRRYRFTTPAERASSGHWWYREPPRPLTVPIPRR